MAPSSLDEFRPGRRVGFAFALAIAMVAAVPTLGGEKLPSVSFLVSNAILAFFYALLCWMLHERIVFSEAVLPRHRRVRIALSLGLGAVFVFLFYPPYLLVLTDHVSDSPWGFGPPRRIFLLSRAIVVDFLAFFTRYYLDQKAIGEQTKWENERLRRENLQARMSSLQDRISPHFLFNSLTTLRSMTENVQAKEYISRLSDVYRHLLSHGEESTIALGDELRFLSAYLHILQARFEGALQVILEVREEDLERKIPPFALQLLVENAVKHNVASLSRPLQLRIHSQLGWIEVSNHFQPRMSVEEGTGTGLSNIAQRYRLLAGREIEILQDDSSFRVKLPLLP